MANSVPPDRGEMVWTGMGWGICQAANHPSGLARQGLLWPVGSPTQANQAGGGVQSPTLVRSFALSLSAACFPALPDRRLAQTRATCSEHSFGLECLRSARDSQSVSGAEPRAHPFSSAPKKDSFRVWRRAWMGVSDLVSQTTTHRQPLPVPSACSSRRSVGASRLAGLQLCRSATGHD